MTARHQQRRALRAVTVFCGHSAGTEEVYARAAGAFGRLLGERDIELVYGGGRIGMMGAVADGALAAGGRVTGVIPDFLVDAEQAHAGLTTMHVVTSMHERKAKMASLGEAFVALPGGPGTLEELVEVMTWSQLGLHSKPIAILSIAGFFDGLIAQLDHALATGFVQDRDRGRLLAADRPETALDLLESAEVPASTIVIPRSGA